MDPYNSFKFTLCPAVSLFHPSDSPIPLMVMMMWDKSTRQGEWGMGVVTKAKECKIIIECFLNHGLVLGERERHEGEGEATKSSKPEKRQCGCDGMRERTQPKAREHKQNDGEETRIKRISEDSSR